MSQPDWSEAPEWAGVFLGPACASGNFAWAESFSDGAQFTLECGSMPTGRLNLIGYHNWALVSERPAAAEWNGTGNPPAGTVCEMTHSGWGDRGWERVTINYCSDEYAITTNGGGEQHWHMRNIHFRAIRTPEQIAADEREAAIEEMYQIYKNSPGLATQQGMAALYDHGYRKQSTKQDDQQ